VACVMDATYAPHKPAPTAALRRWRHQRGGGQNCKCGRGQRAWGDYSDSGRANKLLLHGYEGSICIDVQCNMFEMGHFSWLIISCMVDAIRVGHNASGALYREQKNC
jgi:hypothetical protein